MLDQEQQVPVCFVECFLLFMDHSSDNSSNQSAILIIVSEM